MSIKKMFEKVEEFNFFIYFCKNFDNNVNSTIKK